MSNVLVVAEHAGGELRKINAPVLGFAKKAAEVTGGDVIGLVLGGDVEGIAKQLACYDISKVIYVNNDELENYRAGAHASAIAEIAEDEDAAIVATVASFQGKDLLPRVAARLEAGLAADVSAIEEEDDSLLYKRPIWSGKLLEVIKIETDIACATVRPTEFDALVAADSPQAEIVEAEPDVEDDGTQFVAFEKAEGNSARPELTDASFVAAGGRGLKSREGFVMLEDLADLFPAEGAVGASRAAVDAGMAPNDWQIGQTGKIVAPDLYFAIAVSGAIQHIAGMKGSKCIVAINKDPEAPIFQIADYGLVADAFKAVPALNALIKASR